VSYVFLNVFVGDVTSLEKFKERHDVMMLKMKATIVLLIIAATMGKPIPIGLFDVSCGIISLFASGHPQKSVILSI
jgi:hypothetical protein